MWEARRATENSRSTAKYRRVVHPLLSYENYASVSRVEIPEQAALGRSNFTESLSEQSLQKLRKIRTSSLCHVGESEDEGWERRVGWNGGNEGWEIMCRNEWGTAIFIFEFYGFNYGLSGGRGGRVPHMMSSMMPRHLLFLLRPSSLECECASAH